ncbi:MAG: hypothetical protein DLM57_00200 [Pseudonocardiales bacterium]|nr:MAG: hypothetical protein DLM57_00200 [Pseudonocardiales bacterium]
MGRKSKVQAALPSASEARDLAGSAVETVREHAAAAGGSVGSAVTSAFDIVAERSRRARKKARKKARKQTRSARSTAQSTVHSARRQSARQLRKAAAIAAEQAEKRAAQLDPPKRRRGAGLLAVGVAIAAGVAAARTLGAKNQKPPTHAGH